MSDSERTRVRIDTDVCVGSGTCAMVDPEHFEVVDGKARVADEPLEVTEDLADAVLDCPVMAISRVDV